MTTEAVGGIDHEVNHRALHCGLYLPLFRGAVENLADLGPVGALTGPVRRGDTATIEAHLAVLAGEDRRVYLELARAALALARRAGLPEPDAARVQAVLDRSTGR